MDEKITLSDISDELFQRRKTEILEELLLEEENEKKKKGNIFLKCFTKSILIYIFVMFIKL